jgi:hypothetical protein
MDGVEFLSPEDSGSMAAKLAAIAKREAEASQPPLTPEQEQEVEAARLAEEEAARLTPEQEEANRKAEEEAAAQAAAQEAEEKAKGEGEEKVTPEPPEFKFQSFEDYEKALKAAETKMHTATTETSEERKAREKAEQEAGETKAELERLKAEVAAKEPAKPNEVRQAAYLKAIKTIQEIQMVEDPDTGDMKHPPDYSEKVAAAWALAAEENAQEDARLRREAQAAEAQVATERKQVEAAEAEGVKIAQEAEKLATGLGLDMKPGSHDYRLFYTFVNEVKADPNHEVRDKPFEEQVKWAATGVRNLTGEVVQQTEAEKAAARANQNKNQVLGRGVNKPLPTGQEPPRQRTMAEILESKNK